VKKLSGSFQWIGLFSVVLLLGASAEAAKRQTGTLVKITDGDTVQVKVPKHSGSGDIVLKIRSSGIDTPEVHFNGHAQEPWATKASDHLADIFNAKHASLDGGGRVTKATVDRDTGKPIEVEAELFGKDVHGRALGYVYYKGTNTNLQIMKDGYAYPYLYCDNNCDVKNFEKDAMVDDFVSACEDARKGKKGFFAEKESDRPMVPSLFRRSKDRKKPYQYLGDFRTKKLYDKGEESKIDPCVMVRFISEDDAKALGYKY